MMAGCPTGSSHRRPARRAARRPRARDRLRARRRCTLVCERLVGGRLTAVDRSAKMIAAAERRNAEYVEDGRAEFLLGELEALDLGERRFDVVFAVRVGLFHREPGTRARARRAVAGARRTGASRSSTHRRAPRLKPAAGSVGARQPATAAIASRSVNRPASRALPAIAASQPSSRTARRSSTTRSPGRDHGQSDGDDLGEQVEVRARQRAVAARARDQKSRHADRRAALGELGRPSSATSPSSRSSRRGRRARRLRRRPPRRSGRPPARGIRARAPPSRSSPGRRQLRRRRAIASSVR